ncbi:BadF/BadG/BcrA/BcrD ATPase family protein [soil metagenome]
MSGVIVGLDIGGTKTDLIVQSLSGQTILDTTFGSTDWDAEPVDSGAAWVARAVHRRLPADIDVLMVGIGAQGLDTAAVTAEFEAAVGRAGLPCRAINDAGLLVPAAGFRSGIGVISGTGAIAVGSSSDGRLLASGGWGWVIGDEAGAAGIVRVATQTALLAHDDGTADDGLLAALLADFGVADAERLARVVNDEPTMDNWAPHAKAVFDAAEGGSLLAGTVIDGAAHHLARLVSQLKRRGAAGTDVVAAGGVISNQPSLFTAFTIALAAGEPAITAHLLTERPVVGALAIARAKLESDRTTIK